MCYNGVEPSLVGVTDQHILRTFVGKKFLQRLNMKGRKNPLGREKLLMSCFVNLSVGILTKL